MSIDYSAGVSYGLFIEVEIIERMMTKFPQKIEMQNRFDQLTGKPLGKVATVTEDEHNALVIGKEKFGYSRECDDSLEEGLDLLAKSINRKFSCFRCQEQDGTVYAYVFGLGINDTDSKTTAKLMALVDKNAAKIRKTLMDLKKGVIIKVEPTVTAYLEVC